MSVKYSIIIPTRNGARYLRYAIESVLNQRVDDFELIISDNHSSDGTRGYLATLKDLRVRAVRPDVPLSMAKHFEYAIRQAKGEWIAVIGDDDALQPYFFELVEKLTAASESPVISSRRAYYFWQGCEAAYGNSVAAWQPAVRFEKKSTAVQLVRALLLDDPYFEYPQFYTGTIFRRSLIESICFQQGQVFNSPTPDANSVTLIFRYASDYLYSELPLAWVGSSPKSTGFSQSVDQSASTAPAFVSSAGDFLALNSIDKVLPHQRFPQLTAFNDPSVYFVEALFQANSDSSSPLRSVIERQWFLYLAFVKIYRSYASSDDALKPLYQHLFLVNHLDETILKRLAGCFNLIVKPFILMERIARFLAKKCARLRSRRQSKQASHDGSKAVSDWEDPGFPAGIVSYSRELFPTILDASAASGELYQGMRPRVERSLSDKLSSSGAVNC